MTAGFASAAALQSFVEETRTRLRSIRPLRFLRGPDSSRLDLEAVHHVFRQIHSLKSAANLLGLRSIEQLCHRFEDVLSGYRDGQLVPGEGSEAELEPTLATIEKLVANIRIVRALDVSPELARLARILESRRA